MRMVWIDHKSFKYYYQNETTNIINMKLYQFIKTIFRCQKIY